MRRGLKTQHTAPPRGARMLKLIGQFRRSRAGATSVEFAALATCVALAIVGAVSFVGAQVNTTYTSVSASFR